MCDIDVFTQSRESEVGTSFECRVFTGDFETDHPSHPKRSQSAQESIRKVENWPNCSIRPRSPYC